ncbi:hypothetical protein OPT61_g5997 [Boeremia exigua]|uniref:Uncharacterized protein n=1 Tax=Boeremia exigua TaxID=749465 RepID=A0ACC2I899_9PLEO|nr:hypothetical protein OPT61_g5997 [Boeremia exigua]
MLEHFSSELTFTPPVRKHAPIREGDREPQKDCREAYADPSQDEEAACTHEHRSKDGSLIARDHLLRKPLVVGSFDVKNVLNGGAGCFAKPSDYAPNPGLRLSIQWKETHPKAEDSDLCCPMEDRLEDRRVQVLAALLNCWWWADRERALAYPWRSIENIPAIEEAPWKGLLCKVVSTAYHSAWPSLDRTDRPDLGAHTWKQGDKAHGQDQDDSCEDWLRSPSHASFKHYFAAAEANQPIITRHCTARRVVSCVEDVLSCALAFPANPNRDVDPPILNPCRKGKRACDAAILEDSLLDASKSGEHPRIFHYSDVYGPLAACANCEKTKKNCTFEWLRSQRVSQATQPPSNPAPPAKRRRTDSNAAVPLQSTSGSSRPPQSGKTLRRSDTDESGNLTSSARLGVMLGDFPGIPALWYDGMDHSAGGLERFSDVFEDDTSPSSCDSGRGSSLETPPGGLGNAVVGTIQGDIGSGAETEPKSEGAVMRTGRKRRRRSSSVSLSNGALPCPAISFAAEFVSSANKAFLREGLLKIYHDSFENALSCWLTERTCPYSAKADISLANDGGPDWNRMYHRVFRLDRLASGIRGRQLTFQEDKTVGKALNSAIFSFATQWAQSSRRSRAKYPFDHSSDPGVFSSQDNDSSWDGVEFDRTLQVAAWNEARIALQDAGDIESFRLVLAQIVFSLTQRPHNRESESEPATDAGLDNSAKNDEDAGVEECEDLMSRLNLAIEAEDTPLHLEKGVRLIHALRSRMTMCASRPPLKPRANRRGRPNRPATACIDAADRATVDLLFWLGVMFDTLSSAMHRRPLVLSDEDSNVYAIDPADQMQRDVGSVVSRSTEGVWDIHLFAHQRSRLQQNLVRWPCSFEEAAALLCDAAPVKVLLFRKVTRIQTLLSRGCRGERVERSIKAALSVCEHWEKLYAPFVRDCIQNHNSLPPRVQSWYVCLTGHWHLAALLLADLIEIVDDSDFGMETQQMLRTSTEFVPCFRRSNCQALSDLARCSCPREDATFAQSQDFHFAVNQGALLTEPWTAVLIRAFAKAGVVLLETEDVSASFSVNYGTEAEKGFQQAEDCVQALWYLGRKSDMAFSAAKILGDALKQKRQGVEEKLREMSSYLEAETWHGFDQLNNPIGWDCARVAVAKPRRAKSVAPLGQRQDTIHKFEETVFIAQLAEQHYKQHGRALRIAVDEADWRFNNLTAPQVFQIRDSSNQPAFQGIEKAMFYRICKLLTLNIQLIFVFDGPGVPAKRGKNGGRRINYEQARLLKQVLRCLGIPYREAPGEAEAETQIVSCLAVASGSTITGLQKRQGTKIAARRIRRRAARGFVLFAMLAGGDYHEAGLPGCGAGIALSAVKEGGLAQSLCACRNQRECTEWSFPLDAFLGSRPRARNLSVPANFPDYKILQKYYRPKVTDDELLMANRSLDLDVLRPIDEHKMLEVALCGAEDMEGGEREGMWEGKTGAPFDPNHRVECDYFPAFWLQRVLPADVYEPPSPAPKQSKSKRKEQPDADVPEERRALPTKKKQSLPRSDQAIHAVRSSEPALHRIQRPALATPHKQTNSGDRRIFRSTTPKLHIRQPATQRSLEAVDLSKEDDDDDDDEFVLRFPPVRPSQNSVSLRESLSMVGLGSPAPSMNESEDLARAIRLSMQSPHLIRDTPRTQLPRGSSMSRASQSALERSSPSKPSESQVSITVQVSDDPAVTGTMSCAAAPSELDRLRAAHLRHFGSSPLASPPKTAPRRMIAQPILTAKAGYIDLTGD